MQESFEKEKEGLILAFENPEENPDMSEEDVAEENVAREEPTIKGVE